MKRSLTIEQQETISDIEQRLFDEYSPFSNQLEIKSSDIILENVALHNVFVEIQKSGINHIFGFWILPNGDILKIKEENKIK